MTDNDLYDGLNLEPDTETHYAEILTPEEAVFLDIVRGLDEERRALLWKLAEEFWRKQHNRPRPTD
jgi:hypothetical protein